MLQKDKGPELGNSGPALRGRRWEGTHRLGCCLLNSEYQFRTLLSSIILTIFVGVPLALKMPSSRVMVVRMRGWRESSGKTYRKYWLLL
jgi:hypothetical protein